MTNEHYDNTMSNKHYDNRNLCLIKITNDKHLFPQLCLMVVSIDPLYSRRKPYRTWGRGTSGDACTLRARGGGAHSKTNRSRTPAHTDKHT